jgi:hypothetical protein
MPDIYYSPEAFGLEVALDVDKSSGCYEFDNFVIWHDPRVGDYLWAEDAGCSCPLPFGYVTVASARRGSLRDAINDARVWLGTRPSWDIEEWEAAKAAVDRFADGVR